MIYNTHSSGAIRSGSYETNFDEVNCPRCSQAIPESNAICYNCNNSSAAHDSRTNYIHSKASHNIYVNSPSENPSSNHTGDITPRYFELYDMFQHKEPSLEPKGILGSQSNCNTHADQRRDLSSSKSMSNNRNDSALNLRPLHLQSVKPEKSLSTSFEQFSYKSISNNSSIYSPRNQVSDLTREVDSIQESPKSHQSTFKVPQLPSMREGFDLPTFPIVSKQPESINRQAASYSPYPFQSPEILSPQKGFSKPFVGQFSQLPVSTLYTETSSTSADFSTPNGVFETTTKYNPFSPENSYFHQYKSSSIDAPITHHLEKESLKYRSNLPLYPFPRSVTPGPMETSHPSFHPKYSIFSIRSPPLFPYPKPLKDSYFESLNLNQSRAQKIGPGLLKAFSSSGMIDFYSKQASSPKQYQSGSINSAPYHSHPPKKASPSIVSHKSIDPVPQNSSRVHSISHLLNDQPETPTSAPPKQDNTLVWQSASKGAGVLFSTRPNKGFAVAPSSGGPKNKSTEAGSEYNFQSCDRCYKSKLKCNRALPQCTRCTSKGLDCFYGRSGNKRTKPTAGASSSLSAQILVFKSLNAPARRRTIQNKSSHPVLPLAQGEGVLDLNLQPISMPPDSNP